MNLCVSAVSLELILPLFDFRNKTTRTPIVGEPNDGNHYGPANSFLGSVSEHSNGMAPPLTGENGEVLVFDPRDVMEGGNMVLWHDDLVSV